MVCFYSNFIIVNSRRANIIYVCDKFCVFVCFDLVYLVQMYKFDVYFKFVSTIEGLIIHNLCNVLEYYAKLPICASISSVALELDVFILYIMSSSFSNVEQY